MPLLIPELNKSVSKKFRDGMKFTCHMCGKCCQGMDDGEVFLYKEDILRLAKHLKYDLDEDGLRNFSAQYLKIIDDIFYWKEPGHRGRKRKYKIKSLGFKFIGSDAHCQLINDKNECTVHEARPFQCRSFPFWQKMITSYDNVKKYARKCAGLRRTLKNEGKLYPLEEIKKFAVKEYTMELEYFLLLKKNHFDIYKVYPFLTKDMEIS